MDVRPHTHALTLNRYYPWVDKGPWVVAYGDTRLTVLRGPWLHRRILRAGRKAIRRHDRGTLRAETQLTQRVATRNALHALVAQAPEGEWASQHLR